MKSLHAAAALLVVVGALNWGLVGIGAFVGADLNVVHLILGFSPELEAVAYVLVGASAVYEIVTHKGRCRECKM